MTFLILPIGYSYATVVDTTTVTTEVTTIVNTLTSDDGSYSFDLITCIYLNSTSYIEIK